MVDELRARHGGGRASALQMDAAGMAAVATALQGVRTIVVESGADDFDLQVSSPRKWAALRALAPRIERAGLPAALVRYAACKMEGLESAVAASIPRMPWKQHEFSAVSVRSSSGTSGLSSHLVQGRTLGGKPWSDFPAGR